MHQVCVKKIQCVFFMGIAKTIKTSQNKIYKKDVLILIGCSKDKRENISKFINHILTPLFVDFMLLSFCGSSNALFFTQHTQVTHSAMIYKALKIFHYFLNLFHKSP